MNRLQQKLLSQNFLHSHKLASKLVGNSSIGHDTLVLEIGPGKGIITEALLAKSQHVIAVELDTKWYWYLKNKFAKHTNLTLYHQDFLQFNLPSLPYKVFANIPFAIEGKIVRRLIDSVHPPRDCYLVVMKELAERLCAFEKENWFSVMHKPWFAFSIPYYFKPTDFTPVPNIEAVLLRFTLLQQPLLPFKKKQSYQAFITRGFGNGQSVRQNLIKFYSRPEVDRALQNYSIRNNARPGELKLEQWVKIYKEIYQKSL